MNRARLTNNNNNKQNEKKSKEDRENSHTNNMFREEWAINNSKPLCAIANAHFAYCIYYCLCCFFSILTLSILFDCYIGQGKTQSCWKKSFRIEMKSNLNII